MTAEHGARGSANLAIRKGLFYTAPQEYLC